jgi:hypothetical protein
LNGHLPEKKKVGGRTLFGWVRGTLKYADGRVYEGEFGVKASHGFRG